MTIPVTQQEAQARYPNKRLLSLQLTADDLSSTDFDTDPEKTGVEQSGNEIDVSGLLAAVYSLVEGPFGARVPLKLTSHPDWSRRDVVANYAAIYGRSRHKGGAFHVAVGDDSVDAYVQIPWRSQLRKVSPSSLLEHSLRQFRFPFADHTEVERLSPVEGLIWPVRGNAWPEKYGQVHTGRFRVSADASEIRSRPLLRHVGTKMLEYLRLQEHNAESPHDSMHLHLDLDDWKEFHLLLRTGYGASRKVVGGFVSGPSTVDVQYLGIGEDKGYPQFRFSSLEQGLTKFFDVQPGPVR